MRLSFSQTVGVCLFALAAGAARAQTGIPGMDFSSLPKTAQRELATVFGDEFCYCGCPHSLEACLKTHPSCLHARRMASLAALEAQKGALAPEISVALGTYYQSFSEPRATFKVEPKLCRGPSDAKVTVVELFDYECPHCGAAHPLLQAFTKARPDVRLCVLPFPLSGHANAVPAAQTALFARDRGKFWQLHDLLFENQRRLSLPVIVELAAKAGLPAPELRKALDGGKYLEEIKVIREAGIKAGIDSTPALYFNGRKFGLRLEEEMLVRSVEDEVEWSAHRRAWAAD